MKTSVDQPPLLRRLVAALVLAHLLAVLALAASPRLHAWLHPDEADDDGDCAVVLLLHGNADGPSAPVVSIAPTLPIATVAIALFDGPAFVPTTFSCGRIFEHAPPAVA